MELLLAIDFTNLHTVLEGLYDEMMPLCEDMLDIGRGLPASVHCSTLRRGYGSRWRGRSR